MSLLSVVRVRDLSEAEILRALGDMGTEARFLSPRTEAYGKIVGKYVASGGAQHTDDIQRAQIFGWSARAKRNITGYSPALYEVIPVLIVPVTKEVGE